MGSGDLRYVFMANCKGPEMWVELREDGGVEDQRGSRESSMERKEESRAIGISIGTCRNK